MFANICEHKFTQKTLVVPCTPLMLAAHTNHNGGLYGTSRAWHNCSLSMPSLVISPEDTIIYDYEVDIVWEAEFL